MNHDQCRDGLGRGLASFAALLAVAACDGAGRDHIELSSSRAYEPVGREIRWGASDAQRFGISADDFARGSGGDAGHGELALHYSLPAGWSELPPAQFREINLRVAGDERAECYMTTLAGEGGGLEANVNRWRRQVSQTPLSADEVAALPRADWLGQSAVLVDCEGTWTGMSGDVANSEWRLVGLLLVAPEQSRFLKMVGPRAVIAAELEAFFAFAASFHIDDGGPHDHGADPHAGLSAPAPAGAAPTPQGASGAFTWSVPEGWRRGPEKSMREVTFLSGPAGEVECYVTLLAGDGGGALPNINRWCGQMGRDPLVESELATLQQEPMLGTQAQLVEISRGPSATAPEGHELLLGAVCIRPERSLFVKMTGPRAEVERQREAFVEFCRSLKAQG